MCENEFEAAEMPPGAEGDQERAFNKDLVDRADGHLPSTDLAAIEILSIGGSHTKEAVRCYAIGALAIHSELAHDVHISKSIVLEKAPSMARPLEKGLPFKVLRHQLVAKRPLLCAVLSRAGNAGHDARRKPTAVQTMMRILNAHKTLARRGPPSLEEIVKVVSRGLEQDAANEVGDIAAFVVQWAGGSSGWALRSIEKYENAEGQTSLEIKGLVGDVPNWISECTEGACLPW